MNSASNQTRVNIRPMQDSDIPDICYLSQELGYPVGSSILSKRFASLKSEQHMIFVADYQGSVIGWIHIYRVLLLESDGYGEIGGLVVRALDRRKGIGSQLLSAAERWAADHGCQRVRLSSWIQQKDEAHLFYRAKGFEVRDSLVFQKTLVPDMTE